MPPGTALEHLERSLAGVERGDARRFRARLAKLAREGAGREALDALAAEIAASAARVSGRAASAPRLSYDPALPIVEAIPEIERAISRHPVVVVAGETGSGKSTQLPKILLGAGYGVRGRIGMTQPRRIAARAIAARLAYETATEVGDLVGFTTRFDDTVADLTRVKVMTDGILLNEIHSDRQLDRYDALVIDEAHERSLNVDFLLGYLKQLVSRRDDLKVVVTSATIDPERFAAFYDDAPIIRVGGRGHPVEIRHAEAGRFDAGERGTPEEIATAIRALAAEGSERVLVFLPGEREITETREHLKGALASETEILPLYSRLPRRAQDRVYAPARGPRVVLATNVAETSLTVPGINAVVDTGTARVSRYSPRSKVQRLPVEPISRAAATQRAGRCGREGPGTCIRLYDAADFESRPEYTDPEILRTNLATVILKSKALGIGDLAKFPFLDPPPPRLLKDGYRILDELGALSEDGRRLTAAGRRLSRLPIDPQLGRMLLEAAEHGALRELTIIAAALSVQDPREFPADAREAAAAAYREWADPRSDFLWFLNFWDQAIEPRASTNQLKKLCRDRYVSFPRVREWIDIHRQLTLALKAEGLRERSDRASYKTIHRCLIAGLVSNVARRSEGQEYRLARGATFRLARSSVLAGRRHPWLLVMQVVETRRNTARLAARIDPAWVATVARRLLVTEYGQISWDPERGEARIAASRRLFQHVVQPGLSLRLSGVDPSLAKRLTIREGILGAALPHTPAPVAALRERIHELEQAEARTRRRDLLPDPDTLAERLDARLPASVTDAKTLAAFLAREPAALDFAVTQLMRPGTELPDPAAYPDHLEVLGHRLALEYRFAPGEADDGITVQLPLHLLGAVGEASFERLVPGFLPEKLDAMLRTLPKSQRKRLQPIGDKVDSLIAALPTREGPLADVVAGWLTETIGETVEPGIFERSALAPHLSMRYRVVDEAGVAQGAGRDLAALQATLGEAGRSAFTRAAHEGLGTDESTPVKRWVWDEIPAVLEIGECAPRVRAYPAVTDRGEAVTLEVYQDEREAARNHADGVLRLALIAMRRELKYARRQMPYADAIGLAYVPFGDVATLTEDLRVSVLRALLGVDRSRIGSASEFSRRLEDARAAFVPELTARAERLREVLDRGAEVRRRLEGVRDRDFAEAVTTQLQGLIGAGFLRRFPLDAVDEFPRYLTALLRRIERYGNDPGKDRRKAAQIRPYEARLAQLRATGTTPPDKLSEVTVLIEEFRVSLFAQELGTREKVSAERLDDLLGG